MIIADEYIHPKFVMHNRDPTIHDENFSDTIWISKEYFPNRIFRGSKGSWLFIGKFYPVDNK